MSYDPNFPAAGVLIESAAFRQQFQALKALIDAVGSVSSAVVTGTTTLLPGSAAQATVLLQGGVLKFTFGVPSGAQGIPGGYRGRWPALCPGGGGQCDHAACGQLGHGVGLL